MTAKEIEAALSKLSVSQSAYMQDKDVLEVDGAPVAFIGMRGVTKFDNWWPALRAKIADHLSKTLSTPVADRYAQERGYHPATREVLAYLNTQCHRHFRETDANLKFISARLKEKGVDVEGVKRMIDHMAERWLSDPKMCEYLRPSTLFNATKFQNYYEQRHTPTGGECRQRPALRGTNI